MTDDRMVLQALLEKGPATGVPLNDDTRERLFYCRVQIAQWEAFQCQDLLEAVMMSGA